MSASDYDGRKPERPYPTDAEIFDAALRESVTEVPDPEITRLTAQVAELQASLEAVTRERDDWLQAHEELVDVRAADLQAVAEKMEREQEDSDVSVAKWIVRATTQMVSRKKAERGRDEARAAAGAMRDALTWVLPMAKGYAAANPVGSNQSLVMHAENVLEDFPAIGADVMRVVEAARKGKPWSEIEDEKGWDGMIELSFPTREDATEFKEALSALQPPEDANGR